MSDNPGVWKEAFLLLTGDKLGEGMSRVTHECAIDERYVVKVEDRAGFFQNVMEWEIWQRVKDTSHAKWFAPCMHISPSGTVLLQARTRPLRIEEMPKRMPAFFTDFKRSNYGMFDGHVVSHDYGTSLLFERGMTKAMRNVDWSDL